MRTTLNLDDDVAARLTDRARSEGRSLSRVVNDLVRSALHSTRPAPEPYDPPVLDSGEPLIDVTDVAAALDGLDGNA